jgi:hypothetical protein
MSRLSPDSSEFPEGIFSDGRRMDAKENKEAEDPLTPKWKE